MTTPRSLPRLIPWSPGGRRLRLAVAACLSVALSVAVASFELPVRGEQPPSEDAGSLSFSRDIQPLLAERCLLCHGPDQAEGGLRLDSAELATEELDSGRIAIVPGDPDSSELLLRVTTADESERMPPEGVPLTAGEIAKLRAWIAAGGEFETHWAFRPISLPALPTTSDTTWPTGGIDRWVLARLEQLAVQPSPPKSRESLIRRLYIDLIGLPPTPEELAAFVADPDPDAYERLVDRLLQSEHFGERWGRHWLDLARYADSDGYEKDRPRPNAWRYRDWVIDAINRDLSLDQFTIEQLAGDLLDDASPMQHLATAFHRQTLTNTEGGVDQEEFRVEATFDRTETTAAAWMALTLNCARCHTHKYDAISHRDYYQLFAIFNNADETELDVPRNAVAEEEYRVASAKHAERIAAAEAAYQQRVDESAAEDDPIAQQLARTLADLRAKPPESPLMKAAVIREKARATRRLDRGDFLQPAEEIAAGGLEVIHALHPLTSRHPDSPPDRLDLARWLVDPAHPLTARVMVNQVWQRLFGAGIVPTLGDFGVRGEPPTHPELLDWLAYRLPRDLAWSRKALIKEIVMSATYQQSSRYRPELQTIDPTNKLLARQNRVRVEAEVVRDLVLATSGLLDRTVGGPSVFPPLPPGVAELSYANNFKWTLSQGGDRYRRGMYTFFKRTSPHPTLITFDCPDSNTSQLSRETSNTPLQALTMLNNVVFAEASVALADRVLNEAHGDDEQRLRHAFRLSLSRTPDDREIAAFSDLLEKSRDHYQRHPDQAERLISLAPQPPAPAKAPAAKAAPTETDDANAVDASDSVDTSEPAGTSKPADASDLVTRAAWASTLRILLNLDEFIVRD